MSLFEKIKSTKINIIIVVDIAPVLPSSNVVTNARGISATIPANSGFKFTTRIRSTRRTRLSSRTGSLLTL